MNIGEQVNDTQNSHQTSLKVPGFSIAVANLGAFYCMDINFWYSGAYNIEQRDHALCFSN